MVLTPASRAKARKLLVATVKLLVVVAIVWGVQRTVRSAIEDLRAEAWSPRSLRPGWLVVSAVAYLAGQLPSARFWRALLGAFGHPLPTLRVVRSWYIGSLGKYVPGKAMVIILRTALLRPDGVGLAVSTATIFYETLTTMAVGAFVAGAILITLRHDSLELVLLSAGLMALAGGPTVPPIFKRLARFAGIDRAAPDAIDRLDHLGLRRIAGAWLSLAVGWCLVGVSIWASLCAVDGAAAHAQASQVALSIAAGALAIVAGFVSFIPGGLIVRDVVVLELLAPVAGRGPALVCALLARLIWLVSELVISVILYLVARRATMPAAAPPPR